MEKLFIVSTVGGSVAGLLYLYLLFLYCCRMAKKKDDVPVKEDISRNHWVINIEEANGMKLSLNKKWVKRMRLHELKKATNDFSNENIIDSERRGNLYKATLSNGSLVAVMRMWKTQQSKTEFLSELSTLGKAKHPNLVSLLGFCIARKERLLVYKYMPKRTLYQQLHLRVEANTNFKEWPLRLKIAVGVARGLACLHHHYNFCIVHRNLSSKCILLDQDNDPKISDFGYAKLLHPQHAHLTTFVNGQYGNMGYVAPEYTSMLVASPKGDVYCYGILLLELITGRVPTQEANPPRNFKQNLEELIAPNSVISLLNAVDKSLTLISSDDQVDDLLECLKIANACIGSVPEQRPSMLHVYKSLKTIGDRYGLSTADKIPPRPNNINNQASYSIEQIGPIEICEIHEMCE